MAAVELGQLHARHVGQPVADIDHVGERHAPLFLRHKLVERAVLRHIQHALVDAEEELRFTGVVDRHRGPAGDAVLVIAERRGVNLLELLRNRRALDDLLEAGRNDIVLRLQAPASRVFVHAREPVAHAVKELNILAQRPQHIAVDDQLALGLLEHHIHIGQNLIHLIALHGLQTLVPKYIRFHAQIRNEAVFLHISWGKRMVKVIHNRQNRCFFHAKRLLCARSFIFLLYANCLNVSILPLTERRAFCIMPIVSSV